METVCSKISTYIRAVIVRRMKELRLSQSELGRRIGWSPQRVWQLLNDDDEFLLSTISPLLDELGIVVEVRVAEHAAH